MDYGNSCLMILRELQPLVRKGLVTPAEQQTAIAKYKNGDTAFLQELMGRNGR